MAHGRFQPFHNGHLEYINDVLSTSPDILIIGITNPHGTERAHKTDSHRHLPDANPYTFMERALMVSRSVAPVADSVELFVVPFEIDAPDRWGHIPRSAVQYVNVLEAWDQLKVERFRDAGFHVVELRRPRLTSGTAVRTEMRSSGVIPSDALPRASQELLAAMRAGGS